MISNIEMEKRTKADCFLQYKVYVKFHKVLFVFHLDYHYPSTEYLEIMMSFKLALWGVWDLKRVLLKFYQLITVSTLMWSSRIITKRSPPFSKEKKGKCNISWLVYKVKRVKCRYLLFRAHFREQGNAGSDI